MWLGGGCVTGGVCMAEGACMAGGGHVWLGGVCGMHAPQQILWLRYTVNERAVRILLECILVFKIILKYLRICCINSVCAFVEIACLLLE